MTHHDELPLPDFEHLPLGSLQSSLRTLDADQLQVLRDYETEHANRLPVTELIDHRMQQLSQGAAPSGGDPSAAQAPPGTGTPNPRETHATHEEPAINPPSQGVPTNPAQPR